MDTQLPDRYLPCPECTPVNGHVQGYLPEYPHTRHVTCDVCGVVSVYGHLHCARCNGAHGGAPGTSLCYACGQADAKAKRAEELANGIRAKARAAAHKAGIADADSIEIEDYSEASSYGDYDGFRVTAQTVETAKRAADWIVAHTAAEDTRKGFRSNFTNGTDCYGVQQRAYGSGYEVWRPIDERDRYLLDLPRNAGRDPLLVQVPGLLPDRPVQVRADRRGHRPALLLQPGGLIGRGWGLRPPLRPL